MFQFQVCLQFSELKNTKVSLSIHYLFSFLLRCYLSGCRDLQLGLRRRFDGYHGLILEGWDPTDVFIRHVS